MFYVIKRKNLIIGVIAAFCIALTLISGGVGVVTARMCGAEEENGIELNILMYHSLLKDGARTGKYVVTPQEFEQDLIYLQQNGYHTVTTAELAAYVYDGEPLPEKPVMLTFDDGYYNNYLYAYPLLEKYDMKAVLSVIGTYSEKFSENPETNAYYSHVTWDMIREMAESGHMEILNHSYDMHTISNGRKGSNKKRGESEEQYERVFTEDIMKAQSLLIEKTGCVSLFYTYPFGSISRQSGDILKKLGFVGSLSCVEGKNYVTDDTNSLFEMKRYLRPGGKSSEKFFKKINM